MALLDGPSLLPVNATVLERALERLTQRVDQVPTPLRDLWNPWTCPARFLPWLAFGLSVDVWDVEWPEATKRQMVAEAIERQRRKGTAAAVVEVLDAFDVGLSLHEWFDEDVQGPPFTFEVRLPVEGGETVTAAFIEKVLDRVARVKRASAHFSVAQTLQTASPIGVAAFARPAVALRQAAVQAAAVDWTGTLLTGDGEPLFTEDDQRLEEES